jgi:hypothetical protein
MFRVGLLSISGMLFHMFLYRRWKMLFPKDFDFITINALLMVLLLPMVVLSTVIADRFSYYLIPAQISIFTRIPALHLGRVSTVFFVLPYALLAVFFISWTSMSWHFDQCYMPYQSWIFGDSEGARAHF